jgi:hypothetical protein
METAESQRNQGITVRQGRPYTKPEGRRCRFPQEIIASFDSVHDYNILEMYGGPKAGYATVSLICPNQIPTNFRTTTALITRDFSTRLFKR